MPIYEYRCTSCQAELEKLQKISDPPLVECPECGKDTLVKLISASSFRLKGSGWYETDFKTGNRKNGAAEESSAKTKDDGSPATDAGTSTSDGTAKAGASKAEASKDPAENTGKKESGANTAKSDAKNSGSSAGKSSTQI